MLKILLLALALTSGALLPARGGEYPPAGVAEITILPGWRTETGNHMTALRIRLAPGWKTYWRAPGDAGIPPRFDWTGSRNLRAAHVHWPTPVVFDQNGMRSVGYEDEVVLPIELSPDVAGKAISLRGVVEIGVCQDVCMPMQAEVAAVLGRFGQSDPRIRAALADRPLSAREAGVAGARCAVAPIRDGLRVTATLAMPRLGRGEAAILEHANGRIWISEAETRRRGGSLTAVADLVPPTGQPFTLDRSKIRITVLSQGRAVDIRGCTG